MSVSELFGLMRGPGKNLPFVMSRRAMTRCIFQVTEKSASQMLFLSSHGRFVSVPFQTHERSNKASALAEHEAKMEFLFFFFKKDAVNTRLILMISQRVHSDD